MPVLQREVKCQEMIERLHRTSDSGYSSENVSADPQPVGIPERGMDGNLNGSSSSLTAVDFSTRYLITISSKIYYFTCHKTQGVSEVASHKFVIIWWPESESD